MDYTVDQAVEDTAKEAQPLQFFFDYICPFCYIGSRRLERLMEEKGVAVDWCMVEIHPDNPHEGRPVEELGYPPEQWQQMMDNLTRMAQEEGIVLAERKITTNSRNALRLAAAVLVRQPENFMSLHHALFHTFFEQGKNIGDLTVLQALAAECEIDGETQAAAWRRHDHDKDLSVMKEKARQARLTGVPGYRWQGTFVAGAVPYSQLQTLVG